MCLLLARFYFYRSIYCINIYYIYIGDSPSDGQAATAAGMQSIGVTWGSHSIDKIKPAFTYIAYTINELNSYIIDCLSKMD